MSLDHKDLELIERLIYKHDDDITVAIERNLERLQDNLREIKSGIHNKFTEVVDKIEDTRQNLCDELGMLHDSIHDLAKLDL